MAPPTSPTRPSRPDLARPQLVLSWVLVALILVQAWMAGNSQVLFGDLDIVAHGIVGNVSFLFALATLALAALRRSPRSVTVVAALLVVLMTTQIGLGYSGRESAGAAAWHIPTGVALFGLAVYQASALQARRSS